MKINRRHIKPARIEMMPLIDIVFLLLVFFIYAMLSMAVHRGLQLDLPESSTAVVNQETKKLLSISIRNGANGLEISIDKMAVEQNKIVQQLRIITQANVNRKKPGVLLFAEENISYQQLYGVLDELKKAGITEISLQASTE